MTWIVLIGLACFALGWVLHGVLPRMTIHAHDLARRLWWRWKSRRRGGRPRTAPELVALIRRMSFENPLWGAPRIHGELLKLGFEISQSTVSKYMIPRKGRPTQSWETFLYNHAPEIASVDLLTVWTVLLDRIYAFVVLAHDRRTILHIEVADRPTALWLAGEVARAFACGPRPAFLVRDNDGLYGADFREQVRALGLDDRPTAPASPWQNGHVERLIGSICRECLDHCLILNAAHLRRLLQRYADYYNCDRTHLALDKDSPLVRPVQRRGRIYSHPILGGLHRRYARIPPK